jgi:hypothetical protein
VTPIRVPFLPVGRKHHHQVSQGFQRLFALDKRILLLDKNNNRARLAGVHDCFARKHFCSYLGADGRWSDELEDEWATRENAALPHARRLAAGARDSDARNEIKILAAIHYVRSDAFVRMHEQIVGDVILEHRSAISVNPDAIAAFQVDYGRAPAPGELEQHFDVGAAAFNEGRRFLIQQMAEGYNKTLDILGPLHVQLVWPRGQRSNFVFGDQALVHYSDAGRVSALGGVALGDADHAFLPLGPRLLALFTAQRLPDLAISERLVHELNDKTWRAAVRFIGASPDTDLRRSLQRWGVTSDTTREFGAGRDVHA